MNRLLNLGTGSAMLVLLVGAGTARAQPSLTLVPDDVCYETSAPDNIVTVRVNLAGAPAPIVGVQFFLLYNNTVLDFQAIDAGDPPFTNRITWLADEGAGTIDYAGGVVPGTDGATSGTVAIVTFRTLQQTCDTGALVTFRAHTPPSKVVDENDMVYSGAGLTLNNLSAVTIDSTAPTITVCPGATVVECDGAGNVAQRDAWLNSFGATDNCGTVSLGNNFSALSDDCGATGTTTVTFTATDDCAHQNTCQSTFTIVDTTQPVIDVCPANTTVECDGAGNLQETAAWLDSFAAHDVCGPVTLNNSFTGMPDGCGETGAVTATFTATDACGNQSTCQTTFTIVDTTPPGIDVCPVNTTVECDGAGNTAQLNAWVSGFAAHDVCGPVTLTNTFDALSDDCGATGTRTVTFTATDACDNQNTCQSTFTIADATLPVIDVCPINTTVECDGNGNAAQLNAWLSSFAAQDTCGPVTLSNNFDTLSDDCGETGTKMVIFTATDACGHEASCQSTFTVADTTAPVIDVCPVSTMVECDGQGNVAEVNAWLNSLAGHDVCGTVTLSNDFDALSDDCGATGTKTVTFTVTDDCGQQTTCQSTFAIVDTTVPTIDVCPALTTVECDGHGNQADLDAWLNSFVAHDICGSVTPSNNFDALSDDCGATGTMTVTFTATDACGLQTICTSTFTVVDTAPPIIDVCPASTTLQCDGAGNPAELAAWLNSFAAHDGCGSVTLTSDFGVPSDDCGATGTTTVVFTATDSCALQTTCTATFTIVDTTPPTIDMCPAVTMVECDGAVNTAQLDAWLSSFAASDVCGDVTLTNDFNVLSDDCGATGTGTVVFTATDDCGNQATCQSTFTIVDATAPAIDACPAVTVVECDGAGNTAQLNAWLGSLAGSDVCGTVSVSNDFSALSDDCGASGTTVVTFTVTDSCGQQTACQSTLTIVDTTATVITCPADITIDCEESSAPSHTGEAMAADICDSGPDITYVDNALGVCGVTLTRTWTATDECGNNDVCVQTITIREDITSPAITCPRGVTIECGQPEDPSGTGVATATDNCDPVPMVEYTDSESGQCPKTIRRTWTATDECFNGSSCVQIVKVQDATPPALVCPANVTVSCSAPTDPAHSGQATAPDVCDPNPVITYSDTVAGNCPGTITRQWSAVDDCGNTIACNQTITIADSSPPVITCPANVTIECDESTDPSHTGTATATDDNVIPPTIAYSDQSAGTCPTVISRTWTATDPDNHSSSCVQTMTVEDSTDPVLTIPADVTVECGDPTDITATGQGSATDNCDPAPVVTYQDTNTGPCPWVIARRWTATDSCGNSIFANQRITVQDTTSPEITFCPVGVSLTCGASMDPDDIGTATGSDICDGAPTITYNDSPREVCGRTFTRTWTIRDECGLADTCEQVISDDCAIPSMLSLLTEGQTEECIQPGDTISVTLRMDCLPEPVRGYQAFVEYNPSALAFSAGHYVIPGAFNRAILTPITASGGQIGLAAGIDDIGGQTPTSENADLAVLTFVAGTGQGSTLLGFTSTPPLTMFSDVDGQSLEADLLNAHTIIIDGTPPQITCPPDISASSDAGLCGAVLNIAPPMVSDGSPNPVLQYQRSDGLTLTDPFPVGTTTITWVATDCANNTSTCVQTVTVTDHEGPALTCPADITQTAPPGSCQVAVFVPAPTVSDACGVASVVNSVTGTGDASAVYPVGTTTVTWTATDVYGNTAQCTHRMIVQDAELPAITCPPNVSDSTDPGQCSGAVTIASPVMEDNCGISNVVNDYNGGPDASDIYPEGTTVVTWTVTDVGGNSVQCTHTVTVRDFEPPTITCPGTITRSTDPGACSAAITFAGATATDACGIASLVNNRTGTADASGVYPVGTTMVIWTATDVNGNISVCSHNVVVIDNEPPSIVCPPDIEVNPDAGTNGVYLTIPTPTTSDACGVASVVNNVTGTDNASGFYTVGTTLITWTVTDVNGLSSQCVQEVVVTGLNQIDVSVQLSPVVSGPFTRCITFEVFDCDTPTPVVVTEEVAFSAAGLGTVTLGVPFGVYECMTARDALHTLRRTDNTLQVVAGRYVANFTGNPATGGDWLIGGNLNDDKFIDILDFGVFINQYGTDYGSPDTTCSTPRPQADISGNGMADLADFTFVQINFLKAAEANCCGLPGREEDESETPVRSIAVQDARQYGISPRADINRDGVIDELDVVAFMNGGLPPESLSEVGSVDAEPVSKPEPAQVAPVAPVRR